MSNLDNVPRVDIGRPTEGIQPGISVERTLGFVKSELPNWRDYPNRSKEESEEKLNAQLCKYLNAQARHKNMPFQFHHEEKQTRDRRVDLSVGPVEDNVIDAILYSIFDPFLVFEGKRLPPPRKSREREYVTGNEEKTGGIQRFKLGLHGKDHKIAAMIGYIQKDNSRTWHGRVNSWICDLSKETIEDENWDEKEQLDDLEDTTDKTAFSKSTHSRSEVCVSDSIQLHHFWVVMPAKEKVPVTKRTRKTG
jgi:hypothetical protein